MLWPKAKSALASQRSNWRTVANLGEPVFAEKIGPTDMIEWMPFLQAYSILENTNRVAEISAHLAHQPFVEAQACRILEKQSGVTAGMQKQIQVLLCASKKG